MENETGTRAPDAGNTAKPMQRAVRPFSQKMKLFAVLMAAAMLLIYAAPAVSFGIDPNAPTAANAAVLDNEGENAKQQYVQGPYQTFGSDGYPTGSLRALDVPEGWIGIMMYPVLHP